MPVLLVEARGYLLFFFLVFGDGVGWDFYGDAIARSILTWYRVFRLGRRHQVHRNGAYETLNAIPTGGIAFGVELFLSIAVIDIEGVILVAVAVIDPGIWDAHQFKYLQAGTSTAKGSFCRAFLLVCAFLLGQFDARAPSIHGYTFGSSFRMEGFVDLGIVDYL